MPGHGKALNVVSVGLLLLVPTMIVVRWSVNHQHSRSVA
jgi:hypothetical protein